MAQAADRMLTELARDQIQDLKRAHDKVDRWLEARHPLDRFGEAVAEKRFVETVEAAEVKDEHMEKYIEQLQDLPGSLEVQNRIKQTLKRLLIVDKTSVPFEYTWSSEKLGGKRYLENFMIHHHKKGDMNYIVFAYYSNSQRLSKNWKWLVDNHHDSDIAKWLNYKLYMLVQSKIAALRLPMTCTQFTHKMQNSKLSPVELEEELGKAENSGACSSDELKPYKETLKALQQSELQETMLKYLDEAVTEKNERRLEQLLEQAEQEKNVSPKALDKYNQELRSLKVSRASKNEELEAEHKLEQALSANDPSCKRLLDELLQFRSESNTTQQRDRCKEIKKKHEERIFKSKLEEALQTVKETLESGDGDCEAALRKAKEEGVEAILLQEHEQRCRSSKDRIKNARTREIQRRELEDLDSALESKDENCDQLLNALRRFDDMDHELEEREETCYKIRKEKRQHAKQKKQSASGLDSLFFCVACIILLAVTFCTRCWWWWCPCWWCWHKLIGFLSAFVNFPNWSKHRRSIPCEERAVKPALKPAPKQLPLDDADDIHPDNSASQLGLHEDACEDASQVSVGSWSLIGASLPESGHCFLPNSFFKTPLGQLRKGSELNRGDLVQGVDGKPVCVKKIESKEAKSLVELETNSGATLCVTPNHQVAIERSSAGKLSYTAARELQIDDLVLCDHDGKWESEQIVSKKEARLQDPVEVLEIIFHPNIAVANMTMPVAVLSKCPDPKPGRRGGAKYQKKKAKASCPEDTHDDCDDDLRTQGEYED